MVWPLDILQNCEEIAALRDLNGSRRLFSEFFLLGTDILLRGEDLRASEPQLEDYG